MHPLNSVPGLVALACLVGCGSSSSGSSGGDGGGNGAGGGSSSTGAANTSASSSSSGTSTGTGGAGGSGGGSTGSGVTHACTLDSCKTPDKDCFGLVDAQGASKFGLRMSQIQFSKPLVLTSGVIATVFTRGLMPSQQDCSSEIDGQGTFNWLLQFDTTANTLRTGGARPVPNPAAGYAFIHGEMVEGRTVTDATFSGVTLGSGGTFDIATGMNLTVPAFTSPTDTTPILLPLSALRFTQGVVSASHDCIGKFNGDALEAKGCSTDDDTAAYVNGASLEAYITLEDADTVVISTLKETLCVMLGGAADTSMPQKCKRNSSGKITFQGDWCSTTNAAGGCRDSAMVAASFAAASVKINN